MHSLVKKKTTLAFKQMNRLICHLLETVDLRIDKVFKELQEIKEQLCLRTYQHCFFKYEAMLKCQLPSLEPCQCNPKCTSRRRISDVLDECEYAIDDYHQDPEYYKNFWKYEDEQEEDNFW